MGVSSGPRMELDRMSILDSKIHKSKPSRGFNVPIEFWYKPDIKPAVFTFKVEEDSDDQKKLEESKCEK